MWWKILTSSGSPSNTSLSYNITLSQSQSHVTVPLMPDLTMRTKFPCFAENKISAILDLFWNTITNFKLSIGRLNRLKHYRAKFSKCVVYWKPYCKQVPFDPLKCIAGLMYNVKRIGVWKYEAKMGRDWPPPEVLRVSTYSPGMRGI